MRYRFEDCPECGIVMDFNDSTGSYTCRGCGKIFQINEDIWEEVSDDGKCSKCKYTHVNGCVYVPEDECIQRGYKYFKPKEDSPAEDPNTIHGIKIYCPNCGLTQRGVFTSGKELIAEILKDLKEIRLMCLDFAYSRAHVGDKIGHKEEKWEARKNKEVSDDGK